MPKKIRIRILCDTSGSYFRNVILGARHAAFLHGCTVLSENWLLPGRESLESIMAHSRADGIIAQVLSRSQATKLLKIGVPVVSITDSLSKQLLPSVTSDAERVGRVGADHLASLNCATYACWGQHSARYSIRQIEGFQKRLSELGRKCHIREGSSILKESVFEIMKQMKKWLQSMPRPIGVFTVLDTYGSLLLHVARQMELRVPEDIAILSVGNDEFWVNFEETPLSSIKLPSQQLGYDAVRLLLDLIRNKEKGCPERYPEGVVYEVAPRASTNITFIEDGAVARAAAFIRENAGRVIYVGDVVRASGISRVALQKRFKSATGRSLLDEIHRIRVERAKDLLRNTDRKLDEIAEHCCFGNAQRFCVVFRKHAGQSPGKYRQAARKLNQIG